MKKLFTTNTDRAATLKVDRRLLVAFAFLSQIGFAPAAQFNAGSKSELTLIEVRVEMRGHAANVLRQQGEGAVVGQEVARPDRFAVLVHETPASDSPPTGVSNSRAFTKGMLDDLIAQPDQRSYREFENRVATSSSPPGDSPAKFFVITFVDIAPSVLTQVEAALHDLAAAVGRSHGNLGIEILQQVDVPNHFAFITTWIGEEPYHTFAASVGARQFRRTIASVLNSPYDERQFRRID